MARRSPQRRVRPLRWVPAWAALLLCALGLAFQRDRARRTGWLVCYTGLFSGLAAAVYAIWFFVSAG